jgi:hypothetical protein
MPDQSDDASNGKRRPKSIRITLESVDANKKLSAALLTNIKSL